ncbi:MAG: cbb3-type cytochrome c oxidase subunit I [Octadecabacter sp.]
MARSFNSRVVTWLFLALIYPITAIVLSFVMRLELIEPGLQYVDGTQFLLALANLGAVLLALLLPQVLLLAVAHLFFLKDLTLQATSSHLSNFGKVLLIASPLISLIGLLFATDGRPYQIVFLLVLSGIVLGLLICWSYLLIDAVILFRRRKSWNHCVTFVLSVLGLLIFVSAVVALTIVSVPLFDRNLGQVFFEPQTPNLGAVDPVLVQHLLWILGHPETAFIFPYALLLALVLGTAVWRVAKLLEYSRS